MLDTLIKIGSWQSEGKSDWDRFLDPPKVVSKDKKGNPIKNFTVGIIFDLDSKQVRLDASLIKEYDERKDPIELKSIKIQGGNNKSIYATTASKKLMQIFKTFFGKEDNQEAVSGELIEAIDKDFPQFKESEFYQILQAIFPLRSAFLELAVNKEKQKFDDSYFFASLNLAGNENIALAYACLKSEASGFQSPTPIAQMSDYVALLQAKFFDGDAEKDSSNRVAKLCYASGNLTEDVDELNLSNRYSLNKMFVTKTKNYASLFDKNSFSINYQVSRQNQSFLDLASSFFLNNYKTKIAGIDHVIIPQFFSTDQIDFQLVLEKLKSSSDLLFDLRENVGLDELRQEIELEDTTIFWINFLAFESDGNFFKTTGLIKDVSKFHFQKVIEAFIEQDKEMSTMRQVVDWKAVMKDYDKNWTFNFNTIYKIIPLRKDKEKKNVALNLFKSILEQRHINRQQLFEYFCELILCNFYERYNSYTNVNQYDKDYFGLAVRDNVFKYLAFFQVLKKLNLLSMEEGKLIAPPEENELKIEERIDNFFTRMDFTAQQKAMFFLGRMLNSVNYLQKDKKKTVIEKVNYNGMEKDDIVRLRKDLFEKAKQYSATPKIIFSDAQFGQYFDFNNWNMSPQEAVFFILTGYSFGVVKTENTGSKSNS